MLTLRYVFKTRTPDGILSGAALSFTLQRQADGYRPVGIRLQALPESELQTVEGKPDVSAPFTTRDPYTLYPQLQEVHDLLTRWLAPLRATPGWVHRLTRVHDESSNDLYAGLKDYTMEDWFRIDERGYVTRPGYQCPGPGWAHPAAVLFHRGQVGQPDLRWYRLFPTFLF